MDIVYSGTKVKGLKDRKQVKAINPVFFTAPDPEAKKVYLNGDFPKIKKAYERLNIPVLPLSEMPGVAKAEAAAATTKPSTESK